PRGRHNENGHAGKALYNTMSSTVTMYYPFHPHAGQTLPVVSSPRHAHGSYTVKDPAGSTLKVPRWMTESTAATPRLPPTPLFSIAALPAIHALLSLHGWSATLRSSHTNDGGQHETTQSLPGSPGHPVRTYVNGASDGRAHCGHEPDRQGVFRARKGGRYRC